MGGFDAESTHPRSLNTGMTHFTDSPKPTEPRRTAAVSSGQFESGSVFRLVREIRGSAYSVGDQFMLVESEDCHDPNTLILGGVGENYFIDPRGKPLRIEAGDAQIDSIFELVVEPQRQVIEEVGAEDAPPRLVTEEQFTAFREGLAGVLKEIAVVRSTGGERGERGPRGYTGVQGDKGDAGPQGPQGERGERGETGERGEQGEKGDTGERGPQGERGEPGPQGERGETGLQGERGERGQRGERGEKGERGEAGAIGPQGPQGERGADGAAGADGRDGAVGPRGEKGERGERGAEGKTGKAGAKGAKGEKGDKGDTGESGVVTAKFPLVYDAKEKSIAIDEERLDKILKKIMGGGKVSAQDMGWLASTGGGGKVAVYINGSKITPDVRTFDFTGAGVTATKVGGKVTINIGTNFYYQPDAPTTGITVGSRWMDSDNGQEYVYVNDGNSNQWVQPTVNPFFGPVTYNTTAVTISTYEATAQDYYIGVSYAGTPTIYLPSAPGNGREVVVKDESGNAGAANRYITVRGASGSSETIDNQPSAVLNLNNAGVHFIYRGGWRII